MEKEDIIKNKAIIKNYRNDALLDKIIDEFCFRLKGQITREEVEGILKANGFDALYVLSDEDYSKVNEDDGKEIESAGSYITALKCITLRKSFLENGLEIGCHELAHALIDGKLSYIAKCCEWEVSYGLGLEEGVATAIEKMEGSVNTSNENTKRLGYKKNHLIIRELDLLYQRLRNKRYDSIIVEAIKHPDTFFNLVYRMILGAIKRIYYRAGDKDISLEEIKMIALKCSFVILQSSDMLVEFKGKDVSEFGKGTASTAYGFTRFIIGCLLSSLDKNIRKGNISPEYIGAFYEKDLELLKFSEEERLLIAILGSDDDASYQQRLAAIINRVLVEYVLVVEQLKNDPEGNLSLKKQL